MNSDITTAAREAALREVNLYSALSVGVVSSETGIGHHVQLAIDKVIAETKEENRRLREAINLAHDNLRPAATNEVLSLLHTFTFSLQAQCAERDREIERLKAREEILKTAQLACNEAMAASVKQYERLQILAEERGNAWKFEHRHYQEAQRRVSDVTKDLAKVCAEARDYCTERDAALLAQKQAEERLAAVHKHHDESLESDFQDGAQPHTSNHQTN